MYRFNPPITWKVNDSETVASVIKEALNASDSMYFKAETGTKLSLVPFIDTVPLEKGSIWSRKELELTLKYQN